MARTKKQQKATQQASSPTTAALELIGIQKETPLNEAKKIYHEQLKKAHPDKGGSTAEVQALYDAWDAVKDTLPKSTSAASSSSSSSASSPSASAAAPKKALTKRRNNNTRAASSSPSANVRCYLLLAQPSARLTNSIVLLDDGGQKQFNDVDESVKTTFASMANHNTCSLWAADMCNGKFDTDAAAAINPFPANGEEYGTS